MTEQLSLFAPDTVRPYTPHPEVGVSADEQQAIHKAGIAACRETLARPRRDKTEGTSPQKGWGDRLCRSVGPGWAEDPEGNVVPPCNGQAFDTDLGAYKERLAEVARKAAARAGIAACCATLWRSYLNANSWEEPDWKRIAANAQAQHLRDNAA